MPKTEAAFHNAAVEALRNAGIEGDELHAIAITSQARTFTIRWHPHPSNLVARHTV
ncbi:MAG: hypothetical protein MUQ30_14495 [Anaerolineae bacterium]|nr:hypothetical protein [Anaerolineae bacterium]